MERTKVTLEFATEEQAEKFFEQIDKETQQAENAITCILNISGASALSFTSHSRDEGKKCSYTLKFQ